MNELDHSRVFRFADMPVNRMPNGGQSFRTTHGELLTGEQVALHGSMQLAGTVPNPAHRIEHSEVMLVQEGMLEFTHDGVTETAGPGSVFYIPKGTLHQVKNVGAGPAKYFIVAVGGDVNKADAEGIAK